jgi:hypothetical protein
MECSGVLISSGKVEAGLNGALYYIRELSTMPQFMTSSARIRTLELAQRSD